MGLETESALALLSQIGFKSIGPEAGSLAAYWQSLYGDVKAGSLFAWCQSMAMGGETATLGIAAAPGIISVASIGYVLYRMKVIQNVLDKVHSDSDENQIKTKVIHALDKTKKKSKEFGATH